MKKNNYVGKEYFDKDYFETSGYKSGYSKTNMNRNSYLNKAIAVWITQTLGLGGSERVLEIGCAFGWVVEQMISLYGFDAYGQDISTYSAANAPTTIKERIKECKDVEVVFDGKFDLVYSLETFEHVPKPLVDKYFDNIYACLNDNGILFATICLGHNDDRGADIDQSHQTLQPREWWNSRLEATGFTIRKDLEAEAYELGLQTPEMDAGEWLPREYNWHVFVATKAKPAVQSKRQMIQMSPKARMLIIGERIGEWVYPIHDFFQIDNWGNYLCNAFECDYLGCALAAERDLGKYDVVIASLSPTVASCINRLVLPNAKIIGFVEGTPYLIETPTDRPTIIECVNKVDLLYNTIPKGRDLYGVFCDKQKIMNCGHVFPLEAFDRHFCKDNHAGFNVLTGGYFNSRHGFSSVSAYIGAQLADTVIVMTTKSYLKEFYDTNEQIPSNIQLTHTIDQDKFWADILPSVDLLIHLANEPAQGRLTAECAAGGIPSIGPENLFQIRCFPELLVDHLYDIDQIVALAHKIRHDVEFNADVCGKSRQRLISSNVLEMQQMVRGLNKLGFNAYYE
jgi:protein-L-isoaspartate O-methyltransferase